MKARIALVAIMVLGGIAAYAHPVPINTKCGKTVTLESSDYSSAIEMAEDANAIDNAICKKRP